MVHRGAGWGQAATPTERAGHFDRGVWFSVQGVPTLDPSHRERYNDSVSLMNAFPLDLCGFERDTFRGIVQV
jgi:hypothetical protein